MAPRTQLNSKLTEILGSGNVYFQPPANIKMKFPAIEYHYSRFQTKRADNRLYNLKRAYDITLIGYTLEEDKVKALLELPYCSIDRTFTSDNLYHTTFTLYY